MNDSDYLKQKIANDIKDFILDCLLMIIFVCPIIFIYTLMLRPPGTFFIY